MTMDMHTSTSRSKVAQCDIKKQFLKEDLEEREVLCYSFSFLDSKNSKKN